MNRSIAFVGAVALVAAQPAIALGAHPGGFAPVRMPLPAPPIAVRGNMPLKTFPDARHFRLQSPTVYGLRPLLSGYHWHYGQSRTSYLWFPALVEPACYPNNGAWGSPNDDQASNETLGSLVDGKANILSPQSFNSGFVTNDTAAASASPFSLQAGFAASACGPSSFTSF